MDSFERLSNEHNLQQNNGVVEPHRALISETLVSLCQVASPLAKSGDEHSFGVGGKRFGILGKAPSKFGHVSGIAGKEISSWESRDRGRGRGGAGAGAASLALLIPARSTIGPKCESAEWKRPLLSSYLCFGNG